MKAVVPDGSVDDLISSLEKDQERNQGRELPFAESLRSIESSLQQVLEHLKRQEDAFQGFLSHARATGPQDVPGRLVSTRSTAQAPENARRTTLEAWAERSKTKPLDGKKPADKSYPQSNTVTSVKTRAESLMNGSTSIQARQAISATKTVSSLAHEEDNFLQNITRSTMFETGSLLLILANTVFIAYELDQDLQNQLSNELRDTFKNGVGPAFTIAFLVELCVKMAAERLQFLNPWATDFFWNLTDTVLVVAGLIEWLSPDQLNISTSSFRALRFLRFTRIVQLVLFFKDLRQLVQGIMESMKAFIWCIILSFAVLLLVALMVLQLLIIYREKIYAHEEGETMIDSYFSSLIHTIYTLVGMVTGGVSWAEVIRPLEQSNTATRLLFSMYVAFTLVCIFNVIAAVFVDRAIKISKSNVNDSIMEELSERDSWNERLKEVFHEADADGSAMLSLEEFVAYVDDDRVQAYFRTLGLSVTPRTAAVFFAMLDLDGSGTLSVEEFLEGCSQFVGPARQLDISRTRIETVRLWKEIAALKDGLRK